VDGAAQEALRSPVRRHANSRVALAALAGLIVGVAAAFVVPWQAAPLLGWDVAAIVFLLRVWTSITHMSATDIRTVINDDDPGPIVADLVLLGASVGCLVGVGFALHKANQGPYAGQLVSLTILSVVLSWAVVHTVFTLHYARRYYGDPEPEGGIDFNEGPTPTFVDFAYVAFTVGMTYQVSDTNITSREMRRLALQHALLSFLFGTFILAVTINAIAQLI
jgi:uncharacterized membrane protein